MRITASLYTYLDETSHAVSPWVKYVPYEIKGQNVKGQGHNARITENGFWRITDRIPFTPILMKLHMQSPHESSMDPMDFGVKSSKVKVTMQRLLKKVSGA